MTFSSKWELGKVHIREDELEKQVLLLKEEGNQRHDGVDSRSNDII